MHICCSNCAIYPFIFLRKKEIEISGLWFNPNIHPCTEYKKRLESVKKLQTLTGIYIKYIDNYGLKEFIKNVVNDEHNRCLYCYSVRLDTTAQIAKKMSINVFTTSLLISPYQKFDMIVDIGKKIGEKYSLKFYYEDFRDKFYEGKKLAKEQGFYIQKYCGCIYSEMDRC